MRRSHVCPKCDCRQLLHITHVADAVGEYGDGIDKRHEPGLVRGASKPWRIARVVVPPAERSAWKIDEAVAGMVEALVCSDCGFTELYTIDPQSIPVDGKAVRRIVGPSASPFR